MDILTPADELLTKVELLRQKRENIMKASYKSQGDKVSKHRAIDKINQEISDILFTIRHHANS